MDLSAEFIRLCSSMEKRMDVLDTELVQQKNLTLFSMTFRICRVELVYSRKWETLAPPSVLYARFYLSKNSEIYLHLPELLAFAGIKDFRACYFPYIESPQRMTDCFAALTAIVDDYIPMAERLGESGEDAAILERWATEGFFEDPKAEPVKAEDPIDWDSMAFVQSFQESILVNRHTNLDAYEAFLAGDREKAIQKYEKLRKNGLSRYELGLVEFLKSDESRDFIPMPPQCRAAPGYRKAEKGDKTDLLGFGLLYMVFSALFCGALAIVNGSLSAGTLYYYGVEWWFGLLLGFLPALFTYGLLQRRIRAMLGGSNDFLDTVKDHPGLEKFVIVFLVAVLAGCIWFCVAVPQMSFRLYDTYGIYYTEEETQERFEYADVTAIYHINVRHNVYGDPVERASCILVLSDGRQIDMDCNGNDEEQLRVVAHLFPELQVQYVNSDRDIPTNREVTK